MIILIKNIIKKINSYSKEYRIDNNVKKFISHNKKKWIVKNSTDGIVLVDLFDWYPFVYFYSYITNILIKKYNLKAKYFYKPLYLAKSLKFKFSIKKIQKIYSSFNVNEGINSLNFETNIKDKKKFEKLFKKINFKKELIKYKYKSLVIGDLIYDTYLRTTVSSTVNFDDKNLKKIFIDAHIYFDEIINFYKKNKVKIVIVSHHVYYQYGILARYSLSKKIPVIMIHYLKFGQENFNIIKLDKNCLKDYPYYNYRKDFNKLNQSIKQKSLDIGKKLIKNRVAGKKDFTNIYMKKSTFYSVGKKKKIISNKKQKKIIIFSHNFYDSPHRHRNMIFEDFYEYLHFFCEKSLNFNNYQWIIKPHPNDTVTSSGIFREISLKYPNIKILDKKTSNIEILNMHPNLIITNHSTAGHEFAYLKIPVLNTGDNIHSSYKFNYHAKSKKELIKILKNLSYVKNKISFNKKDIYEFMYMHFVHYYNRYDRHNLIQKNFFYNKNILKNKKKIENDSNLLDYYIKNDKSVSKKIIKYIENFSNKEIDKNLND